MDETPRAGLLDALRRLAVNGLEIVAVRIELLGTELEQEKGRLYGALVRAAIGLVFIALALVLFIGFVLLLFEERYRLAALGVMLLAFAVIGAALLHSGRQRLRAHEGPFAATLGELRRDRDGLGPP